MSFMSRRARPGVAVGLSLTVAVVAFAVAPSAFAAEPAPAASVAVPSSPASPSPSSPSPSVAASPAPSPSSPSPAPSVAPSPSSSAPAVAPSVPSGAVEAGAEGAEARTAALVSISGRVVFDPRTTAAQRARVEMSASAVSNPGPTVGTAQYDATTGAFTISGLTAGKYSLFTSLRPESGGIFEPANNSAVVEVTSAGLRGVVVDFRTAQGGLFAKLEIVDESVDFASLRLIATDVRTGAELRTREWGGFGGYLGDFIAPTGTALTLRAQSGDGRVVYYDGTSTGSSDPARAVSVTTGLWDWKDITLDWAAAAAPKLASSAPTVSGIARVGRALTVTTGAWARGATLTYQWSADGVAVRGATATSFTPGAGQRGKKITVTVTGTLAGYSSVSRTSKSTAVVATGILTAPTPTVRGTARVGTPLTAVAGSWTSGTTLTYQWFANGAKIGGATAASFTPTTAQRGATLTVAIRGTKAGYTARTVTSKPTSAVAR